MDTREEVVKTDSCDYDKSDICLDLESRDCSKCVKFFQLNAIIVYCDNKKCIHYKPINFKHCVRQNRNASLFEDSAFKGICGRPQEIGIKESNVINKDNKWKVNDCKSYSDMKISGHMDFSRFPQGGHID